MVSNTNCEDKRGVVKYLIVTIISDEGGGTVHCMEDNFVIFFGSLIQLFMIDYHRLDTYT